jgi:hypothetical protein
MIGTYLVHGWMHLFMVQIDYRLFGTCWCMVDALVYGTSLLQVDAWFSLLVQVYNGISHSDSVIVVPSFYFYFRAVGRARTGGCSHLQVVASFSSFCSQRIGEFKIPLNCSLKNKGVGASFQLHLENKGIWCFQ